MDKIPSFCINHLRLLPGLYVSRLDRVGEEWVTTLDVRLKAPNREPALHPGALHTIEHLVATFLRSDPEWGPLTLYWGPMGCLTGCYLLVKGRWESRALVDIVRRAFLFVASYEGEVPGCAPRDCGNYLLHDLPMARLEAAKYAEALDGVGEERLVYPE